MFRRSLSCATSAVAVALVLFVSACTPTENSGSSSGRDRSSGKPTSIEGHVRTLADDIGVRSPLTDGGAALERAAKYIESTWTDYGYEVHSQRFSASGVEVRNLWITVPGSEPDAERIVVGAHYDTVATTPGADDNASGTAIMLELSRRFRERPARQPLIFVAFTTEEPPHFQKQTMGSWRFARKLKEESTPVEVMISLESLGYFTDEPNSQRYPTGLSAGFPTEGNFVGVVGRARSSDVTHALGSLVETHVDAKVVTAAVPAFLEGVGWSDHWSFWQHGFEAVMVTDTATFRNPNYHQPSDTADTLHYPTMETITDGLFSVIDELTR